MQPQMELAIQAEIPAQSPGTASETPARLDGKYLLNTRGFHWINEFPFNR
jgi:hypothetical protein